MKMQLLGQDAEYHRLKQHAADRLRQITAEPLFLIEKLIVASRIGSQSNQKFVVMLEQDIIDDKELGTFTLDSRSIRRY